MKDFGCQLSLLLCVCVFGTIKESIGEKYFLNYPLVPKD